jgi:predicted RNA-binding protein with PIN domain
VVFLVDGMNVIGTEPNGWWRDRSAARRRLVEDLAVLQRAGLEMSVVFDGRPSPAEQDQAEGTGVDVSFAPGGRNAADDAIVEIVRTSEDPAAYVVVTSDRALVERVRVLGAQVESSRSFRARLTTVPPAS